jgi:hypothetical protein
MQKTVRVRIAVAIAGNGEWAASGAWNNTDVNSKADIFLDMLPDGVQFHWVEADIPVPPEQVIEGIAHPDSCDDLDQRGFGSP